MGNSSYTLGEDFHDVGGYTPDFALWTCLLNQFDYRLARTLPDCPHVMNLIKYFELMFCSIGVKSKLAEIGISFMFMLIALILMLTLSYLVEYYFSPVLTILATALHMNQYLAGATLLGAANSLPDMIASMLPVRSEAPIYAITVSNSVATILISGGAICYLKSFQMNAYSTLRDLLFLLLAIECLTYMIFLENNVTMGEAACLTILYFVFVFINVLDLILMRQAITSLRDNIADLLDQPQSSELQAKLNKMQKTLRTLESDNKLGIHENSGSVRRSSWRINANRSYHKSSVDRPSVGFATPKPERRPNDVDYEATRTVLHNNRNSRNLYLLREFLESLLPIQPYEWRSKGWCGRICLILRAPMVFFCTIFIPVVDYQQDKHGWSKLLNCTQIITCPILVITFTQSMFENRYGPDHIFLTLNFDYSKWSLCITVPMALIVFCTSRTDLPPPYHSGFLILTGFSALLMIANCAAELEVLCCIIGWIYDLTESYLAVTFRSLAAGVADVIVNVTLAMQGYEKMAFAAVFGGPLFNIVIGMSMPCMINKNAQVEGAFIWLHGQHGSNCFIFFLLTLSTSFWWMVIFNFYARRSVAIFSFILYVIFLVYATCVEFDLIHEFGPDPVFNVEEK